MGQTNSYRRALLLLALAALSCNARAEWNNPYPAAEGGKNILYTAFRERPKHLDPARAYSSNEYDFIAQIYEPPFQYHYLKRPYALAPLTAVAAYSVYEIRIRPGIYYQPPPAFARDAAGKLLYHALDERALAGKYAIADFPRTGTRELVAADYVYQIKRLAHPKLHSPILSVMGEYIVGMKDYAATLTRAYADVAGGR